MHQHSSTSSMFSSRPNASGIAAPRWLAVPLIALSAMALTAWGLYRMQINPTYKAFLGVSWLFLISTVFTLAKTLRDAHEAHLADARAHARRGE